MQVPAIDAALHPALPSAAGVAARVVAGNLAALPPGTPLQATVTSSTPRSAVLTVNGQTVTVSTPAGSQLQPGAILLVRVPPGAPTASNPTLDLLGPAPTPTTPQRATTSGTGPAISGRTAGAISTPVATLARTATQTPVPSAAPSQPQLRVVDVLAPPLNGRVQVSIDGAEESATAATDEPLVAGGRYILQVDRTATGVVLKPPPDNAAPETEFATALLRSPAPEFGAALGSLQTELAGLLNPQAESTPSTAPASANTQTATTPVPDPSLANPQTGGTVQGRATTPAEPTTPAPVPASAAARPQAAAIPTPVPAAVRAAAAAVTATLQSFLPSDPRPPNATELQNLVANGGRHFEAKLARLVADPSETVSNGPATTARQPNSDPTADQPATGKGDGNETPPDRTPTSSAGPVGSDLKGDLLRLLQAVRDIGGTVSAPAAEGALRGIETQQGAQVLAQANGTPYYLQIPFPDGGQWRTLHLALEPQTRPDDPNADQPGRFRVFMHVPLTDLGETWIDAGLSGDKFRATIYLDRPAVRDRVRAGLADLRTELQNDGFSEVLLDVRATSDLPAGRRREAGALAAGRPDTVSVLDVRV